MIVESAQTLENTYGAVKTYYYTVGGYQILLYDSADQAELAVTNLKKITREYTFFRISRLHWKRQQETAMQMYR